MYQLNLICIPAPRLALLYSVAVIVIWWLDLCYDLKNYTLLTFHAWPCVFPFSPFFSLSHLFIWSVGRRQDENAGSEFWQWVVSFVSPPPKLSIFFPTPSSAFAHPLSHSAVIALVSYSIFFFPFFPLSFLFQIPVSVLPCHMCYIKPFDGVLVYTSKASSCLIFYPLGFTAIWMLTVWQKLWCIGWLSHIHICVWINIPPELLLLFFSSTSPLLRTVMTVSPFGVQLWLWSLGSWSCMLPKKTPSI